MARNDGRLNRKQMVRQYVTRRRRFRYHPTVDERWSKAVRRQIERTALAERWLAQQYSQFATPRPKTLDPVPQAQVMHSIFHPFPSLSTATRPELVPVFYG